MRGNDLLLSVAVGVGAAVVAIFVTLLVAFLWRWFRAPTEQRDELRKMLADSATALARERVPTSPIEACVANHCQVVRMVVAGHVSAEDLGKPPYEDVSWRVNQVDAILSTSDPDLGNELHPAKGWPTSHADTAAADAYVAARLAELERVLERLREDG